MTNKEKRRFKRLKTINDLCEELVYLDEQQKWYVDDITDKLTAINKFTYRKMVDELNEKISERRGLLGN